MNNNVNGGAARIEPAFSVLNIKEWLAAIVESSDDAIFGQALDGTILTWNRGAERIYGYPAEEAVGQTIALLIPPERTAEGSLARLRDRQTTERFETTHITRDGRRIDVAVTVSPIFDEHGRKTGSSAVVRDVTERARLRRERDELAAVVDSTHDAVIRWLPDGTITSWNPASERLYGYGAAEAIGRSLLMLVPDDRRDNWFASVEDLKRGHPFVQYESVRLHKDGTRIPVSLTVSPIFGADGTVIAIATIARDITEAKRAQAQLLERAQQQYAVAELGRAALKTHEPPALMDQAACLVAETLRTGLSGVFELQPDGDTLLLQAGFGWQAGEVGSTTVPVSGGLDLPELDRALAGGALLARHGVASGISVLIRGEDTTPYGVLSVHDTAPRAFSPNDVNFLRGVANVLAAAVQRHRIERSLRESEERLRFTMYGAEVGIWEWDAATGRVIWSDNLEAIHGRPPGSFAGTLESAFSDVLDEDRERVDQAMKAALGGDGRYSVEYRIRRADGAIAWIEALGRADFDADGRPLRMTGMCREVTGRKTAEEQKVFMLSELEHRVRNTLGTVMTITSLAARHVGSVEEFRNALLGRLEALAQSHRLLGRGGLESCELRELVEQAIVPYRGPAHSGCTLDGPAVRLGPAVAVVVGLVLHELATNAAKYGALRLPDGRLEVAWRLAEPTRRVELEWAEHGVTGIAPPSRQGFGTMFITRSIAGLSGAVRTDYAAEGLRCVLSFELQ